MISYDYKLGVKREVVSALRKVFGTTYPDAQLRGKISVHLDYPLEQISYPAIILHFQEANIRNAGVGGYWLDEENERYRHWLFQGTLSFVILAKSSVDRDMISAALVSLLSFGADLEEFIPFYEDINDSDYVDIQLLNGEIQPNGDQVGTVPWGDPDEQLYSSTYSIPIFGEFYSVASTGDLTTISSVGVYPYKPGDPVPEGSSDNAEWQ